LLAAVATAVLGAVCGIGGGILLKPLLDAFSGMDAGTVSFLSGCTVLSMAAVSLLHGVVRGKNISDKNEPKLNLRVCALLSAGAVIGGLLGRQLFHLLARDISGSAAGAVQSAAILLMCAAVLVYLFAKKRIRPRGIRHPLPITGAGLALGTLSAFLGIGGGPLNHVVLSFFFGMDTKTGAANSLLIVFFAQAASLAGTAFTGSWPVFDWRALLLMCAGGALGGLVGSALAKRAAQRQVEWTLRAALMLMIGVSAYNLMRFLAAP